MRPLVIPIFITHQGCPHRCIFCDQSAITGQAGVEERAVVPATVKTTIEEWLSRAGRKRNGEVQVAFYGGSFTGLSGQRQKALLSAVKPYLEDGRVNCIRISTRPDYIDDQAVLLLKKSDVSIVELGIQSLDRDVLEASARGHSVRQSEDALMLLRKNGFTVGAQIMCGLPGDSTCRLMATGKKLAAMAPDFVRIYPVLVLKGSGLATMFRNKRYMPLSLAKAIGLACRLKTLFDQHGIQVVRMGLQPSAELAENVEAGPYHPSFGELVISRALFKKARKVLRQTTEVGRRRLLIAAADESAFRGAGNSTIRKLSALGLLHNVELVFAEDQPRNSVSVC